MGGLNIDSTKTILLTWDQLHLEKLNGFFMEQIMTFTLAVQDKDHHIDVSVSDSLSGPRISIGISA